MDHVTRAYVGPHDVAARVDRVRRTAARTREIDRREIAALVSILPPQEKAMHGLQIIRWADRTGRGGNAIRAHDVAVGIDPDRRWKGIGLERPGHVNRGEFSLAQQEGMPIPIGILVAANDVASRVDLERVSHYRAREINRREGPSAQQEAVIPEIGAVRYWRTPRGIAVRADDVPAVIDPKGMRVARVGDIDARDGAAAPQEAVEPTISPLVPTDDITMGVDPLGSGVRRADIDRRERALMQQIAMVLCVSAGISADNGSARTDVVRFAKRGAWHVNRREQGIIVVRIRPRAQRQGAQCRQQQMNRHQMTS